MASSVDGNVTVPCVPLSPRTFPVGPNMMPLQSGKATPGFSQSLPGEDEDEDEGENMTAKSRRNTEANARRRDSEPLFIPPPSWKN